MKLGWKMSPQEITKTTIIRCTTTDKTFSVRTSEATAYGEIPSDGT